MGLGLQEWAERYGAMKLWEELDIHVECANKEDFARLAMISFRQWVEEQGVGKVH